MSVVACVCVPPAHCPSGIVYRDRDDAIGFFGVAQRGWTIDVFAVVQVLYCIFFSSAAGSDVSLGTLFLLFLHVLYVMTG